MKFYLRLMLTLLGATVLAYSQTNSIPSPNAANAATLPGFTDAAAFGFSPAANGQDNTEALQRAVDEGGTIMVSRPGIYRVAGTVYIGGNTSLIFGNNVFLKKVSDHGVFSHVLLNKGALTRTYDQNITIEGLQIIVNGMDCHTFQVYGLRGQLAFFYVKDLHIDHFRCLDLGTYQFGIQVCTFEDLTINDVIIKGDKDGVHLGRGRRFTISNGIFQTLDDAVALNAHDYATSNPELGWIEDGVVMNCHDLPDGKPPLGYFCRILAGAWIDWKPGMEVRQSDSVVSEGRIYRVQAKPDGTTFKSITRPVFPSGSMVLDGINWGMVQTNVTYTAGVRNVVFRDIFLKKPRTAFSIHFDNDKYNRSYYPGAGIPEQEQLVFDNVRVLYDQKTDFLLINAPVDIATIVSCSFRDNDITFSGDGTAPDYQKTRINMMGCIFSHPGPLTLVSNSVTNKIIELNTSASAELSEHFTANVVSGGGTITVNSDLTGLKQSIQ